MEGMKEIVLALVDIFFVLQDWIFDWVITCLFAQTGHVKWAIAAAAIITLPGLAIMVGMERAGLAGSHCPCLSFNGCQDVS